MKKLIPILALLLLFSVSCDDKREQSTDFVVKCKYSNIAANNETVEEIKEILQSRLNHLALDSSIISLNKADSVFTLQLKETKGIDLSQLVSHGNVGIYGGYMKANKYFTIELMDKRYVELFADYAPVDPLSFRAGIVLMHSVAEKDTAAVNAILLPRVASSDNLSFLWGNFEGKDFSIYGLINDGMMDLKPYYKSSEMEMTQDINCLSIQLEGMGVETLGNFTEMIEGRLLAIVVNNQIVSIQTVSGRIEDGIIQIPAMNNASNLPLYKALLETKTINSKVEILSIEPM